MTPRPEGAVVTAYEPFFGTKYDFELSYAGGSGQDVILTVIPEPAALMLLGMAALGFLFRRCRLGKSGASRE